MNTPIENYISFLLKRMSLRKTKRSAAIHLKNNKHRLLRHFVPRNDVTSENGSVILWILIAVGLMAALSYAFMGSSRNSTGMITDVQAEAYASEIIAYGNEVKQAVKRLQLRGCSDTEISFENNLSSLTNYTNTNSPTDKSCHVLSLNGGGRSFKTMPKGAFVDSPWGSYEPEFKSGHNVAESGTSASDLDMQIHDLKLEVCIKINELLDVNNPSGVPPEDGNTAGNSPFIGAYDPPPVDGIGDDIGSGLSGKLAFCRDSDTSTNAFYQYNAVLITR